MASRLWFALFLGLLLSVAFIPSVHADEEAGEDDLAVEDVVEGDGIEDADADIAASEADIFVHPLTNIPPPADNVEVVHLFTEHQTKAFRVGDIVDVAVGFNNRAEGAFNVSYIMGSLNTPYDFRSYIYNFTMFEYNNQTVLPDSDAAFLYKFLLDSRLEPRPLQIALTVFYQQDGKRFAHTFFNETVNVVEAEGAVDAKTFFTYFAGVAAVILAVVVSSKFQTGSKSSSSSVSSTSSGAAGSDDWLRGTSAEQRKVSPRRKTPSRRQ